MKINTKIRYALRSMIEIGAYEDINGILQKEIAKKQNISVKYLDHIIAGLKAAGLIVNSGGKKSGYVLTKVPKNINVYDIYRAFEPNLNIVNCLAGETECENESICVVRPFWDGLNNLMIEYLKNTTIDELIKKQEELKQNGKPNMYYI